MTSASLAAPCKRPAVRAPVSRPERRVLALVRWPLGGIRTHLVYTYPYLAEAGYRFTFVGPEDDSLATLARSLEHVPGCEFVGVPVRRQRCPLWSTARTLLCSGRFDLLHCHGLTAAVHGVLGNVGLGVPQLATVHDVFRSDQFAGWRGRIKRWVLGWLLRRVATLVSVSADVQANLLDYLPTLRHSRCRLLSISNGIQASHYRAAGLAPERELRRRLGLSDDTVLFGFLGRFMEQKGFSPWLLQSLERLQASRPPRPFHLVAVGSGDHRSRYERELARRGLTSVVTLLDFVPDVLPVLRQLDLLVVPSLWEASSLVSMEAMAVGVPVVGSACIGLREVLRDTPSRLVPTGDVAALCQALRSALEHPWTDHARAFAPAARARFDSRQYARQLGQVFEEMIAP